MGIRGGSRRGGGSWGTPKLQKEEKNVVRMSNTLRFST